MRRYSTLWALLAAVLVFGTMFAALPMATDPVRLAGPAALAVLAAVGVKTMTSRTAAQITDDEYHDDARGQVRACLDLVERIRKQSRPIRNPAMHQEVQQMAAVVPELLSRIERNAPTSLYSSASQFRDHLTSLSGVVSTYADIERNPAFYPDPAAQLAAGEQAVHRFTQFSLDSIRLVNQGDLAQYRANLATVAPPEIPSLGAPTPKELP